MSIVSIVVVIIVIGVLLWLVQTQIPMAAPIKNILTAVVVIATVVWVLSAFGLLDGLGTVGPHSAVVRPRC